MSEKPLSSHNTEQALAGSGEVRHNPDFATVVVGSRNPTSGLGYRKGEAYSGNETLEMSRFLHVSEGGQSSGMVVVCRDDAGHQRRFYIMRGAPKGVAAGPNQVSVTDVESSIATSDFETKVTNPESIADKSITVGQEFVPGAGTVQRIVMDTGEKVAQSEIDTDSNGRSLFASELRDTQQAMKEVERFATPSPVPFQR